MKLKSNFSESNLLEYILDSVGLIAKTNNVNNSLIILANLAKKILNAQRCSVWLIDKKNNEIWTQVTHGVDEIRIPLGTGIVGDAINKGKHILIKDAYKDSRFNREVDKKTGFKTKSIIVNVLKNSNNEIIGAFQVINKIGTEEFSEQDLKYLIFITTYAQKALDAAMLNNEMIKTQKDVLFKLSELVENRSKETGNHVRRVAKYSALFAQKLNLDKKEIEILESASPMHDIGKIAIADAILKKPGKLTNEEYDIMKTHTKIGGDILKDSSKEIFDAASIISMQHHERYDGTGYPNGLKGEKIHIFGRITSIADVFDALGTKRVYKDAWPLEKIIEVIKEESGKQFDPILVEIFLNNLDEFLEIREKYAN